MKKEYSYGAVLYKVENGEVLFLVEHMGLGHTSLPKGHIEEGESIEDCVHRELLEELGIHIKLDTSFSKTISYSPYPDILKDVTFFLATPLDEEIKVDHDEVVSAEWLNFMQALQALTFPSDKDVLEEAKEVIFQKYPTICDNYKA